MRRPLAIVFLLAAAYLTWIGAAIAYSIFSHVFEGPWLGPEPEMMIPLVPLALAAGLVALGMRIWPREP